MAMFQELTFWTSERSSKLSFTYERIFMPCSPQLFLDSFPGRIDLREGHPPRVRCAGTSWSIRWYKEKPQIVLNDKQEVLIVGRQGIHLLVILQSQSVVQN
jgi:hypothetical protein